MKYTRKNYLPFENKELSKTIINKAKLRDQFFNNKSEGI